MSRNLLLNWSIFRSRILKKLSYPTSLYFLSFAHAVKGVLFPTTCLGFSLFLLKHLEKFLSVFGGHHISMYITPKKEKGYNILLMLYNG
jgi:hypothetical protein